MPSEDSTTKFKADISQLKSAMQEAARQVRLANSEFKAATAGMDKWDNSADGLSAKLKQLSKVLNAQKTQLSILEKQYALTAEEQGENSKGAQELMIRINNQKAAIAKTENQLKSYADELGDIDKESEEAGDSAEDLVDNIKDAGNAADSSSDGFTVMKGALASLVADGIKLAINGLKDLANSAKEAYEEFDAGYDNVITATGATGEAAEKLTESYKNVSKAVIGDLDSIGSALGEVNTRFGFTGSKLEDATVQFQKFADITGTDATEAVKLVSRAMGDAGIDSSEYATVLDQLAVAAQASGISVDSLTENLTKYGAPMRALGFETKDAIALFSQWEKAGVNTEIAFSGMKKAIANWTKEGKDGKKEFAKFVKGVQDGSISAEKALDVFGTKAGPDLVDAIQGGRFEYEDFLAIVEDSQGAVTKTYDATKDGFDKIKLAIQGAKVEMGSYVSEILSKHEPEIEGAINKVQSKAEELIAWAIQNGDTIISILKTVGASWAAIFVLNKYAQFIKSINTLIGTYTTLASVTNAVKSSQLALNAAQLASPVGLVVTALAALTAGMVVATKKYNDQIEAEYGLNEAQKESIKNANKVADAYDQMDSARSETNAGISAEYGHLEELKDEYNSLIDSNGKVKKGYEDRANFILTTLANSLGVEVSEIQKVIDKNGELGKSIDDLILKKQAEALLNANESSYNEAIQSRDEALQAYQSSLSTLEEAERSYADAKAAGNNALETYNDLLISNPSYADDFYWANRKVIDGEKEAKDALEEANKGFKEAEGAYVGYNSTISNYEGLSAAIISGDVGKIKKATDNLQNNFITAKNGTKATLQQQVKDTQAHYNSLKKAVEDNTPGVTQAQVDQAEAMVKAAKKELDKLPKQAEDSGKKAGENFALGIDLLNPSAVKAGENLVDKTAGGINSTNKELTNAGTAGGKKFVSGVEANKGNANKAGQNLTSNSAAGAKTGSPMNAAGQYTSLQFVGGVNSKTGAANQAGRNLGSNAASGAGSYSGAAQQSGSYFGQGFFNGIASWIGRVFEKAKALAHSAHEGLKKGQQEGSPSKLTYKSGVFFTQGYINGIASQQKNLVKVVKDLAGVAVKQMLKVSDYDFANAASNVSQTFADGFSKKLNYITDRISYQNEKKLAQFDSKVTKLENERDKKVNAVQKKVDATKDSKKKASLKKQIESIKKSYEKLINEEKEQKTAYQKASSKMLSEFSSAMNEYQTKAQDLIDSTIGGIADKYQTQYDELISKQDSLIDKMKSAGDLFEISGAGVITVNDIKEQTKQIQDYAAKLKDIKNKVSADLFDQITSYDMKEGSAFIDQLLAMSKADLKAYSDAYDEKMSLSENLSKDIYKKDVSNVVEQYKNELNKALKNLPKELEKLGTQSMKGFLSGLTTNTNYMEKAVKTYIKGMVDTFKKELKIHSPSRVMAELGEYTGEGFGDGLRDMVGYVKKSASSLVDATSTSLSDVKSALGSARYGSGAIGGSVVNNYNLVQNNTSPKSLSALETYQARRQQIALVKAFT